ncbi:tyrosine-type recombinase/integrase [Carnobacterium maltaromaticum]|uniref:tyrosine-type recombinase/integrase n=1 Tax=Carnobacterium maltaromaticum TaxID=2751 RepID=UPI00191BC969|nr:tyrosine-type recombinase/integrase [Carnobacterium maltaromaticum]CAD5902534.1 conserved hypothetical protein [Carnobacterium maltaromaticum]
MQFERVLIEYLLELKLQNYSKRTIESYHSHNQKFIKFYEGEFKENPTVYNISRMHYKRFISELIDNDLKATYINTILKSSKAFWQYLIREQIVKENPLMQIKLLKENKAVVTTFNDDEIKRMLNACKFETYLGARNKCIIAVLVDTGIRVSELIAIKNSDISEKYIKILGKGNKWRVVPISNQLNYFLIKFRRIRDKHFSKMRNRYGNDRILDDELFLSKTGKKLKSVENIEIMIRDIGCEVNVRKTVRCSPHTFRHYWTVKNLQNNQDIYTISKLLGHSKLNTTQIYINSITNEQLIEKAVLTSPLSSIL